MKLTSKMLKQMITEEISEGFLDKFFGAFGAKDKPQDDTVVMGLDFRWNRPELAKQAKALGYTDEEIRVIADCHENMPVPPGTETSERLGGLVGTNFSKKFQGGTSEKIPVPKNFIEFHKPEKRGYRSLLETLAENMSGNRWFRDLFYFSTDRGDGNFKSSYTDRELNAFAKIASDPDDTYNRILRSLGVPKHHLRKDTTRTPSFDKYLSGL